MDIITYTPGFSHILNKIFMASPTKDLINCQLVCQAWHKVLNDPQFWLKKCPQKDFTEKKKNWWKILIQTTKTKRHLKQNSIKLLMNICLKNEPSMISPFHAMLKFKNVPLLVFCLGSASNDQVLDMEIEQLEGLQYKYGQKLIDKVIKDLEKLNYKAKSSKIMLLYSYNKCKIEKSKKSVTLCQIIENLESVKLKLTQKTVERLIQEKLKLGF